jgi:protein-L-isoaspartate(D-aspartate) O-methyltransferase
MSQFAIARRTMLDNQIRTTDVTDAAVLAAFGAVPRERFVPAAAQPLAYTDQDHRLTPGTPGRFLLAPSPLAKLIQLLEVGTSDKVLVVGSGSGYSVAVIAAIAASVIGLESDETLAASSTAVIAELHLTNASIVEGELTVGYAASAPYDAILVEGAVDFVPAEISAQLAEGGRLVVVEGHGASGSARLYTNTAGTVTGRNVFNCAAKPLPGFEHHVEFVF